MKKTILLLLTLAFLLIPQSANAQAIGDSCCGDGYIYHNQACLREELYNYFDEDSPYVNVACTLIAGTSLGPARDLIINTCKEQMQNLGRDFYTSANRDIPTACNALAYSLGNVLGGAITQAVVNTACVPAMEAYVNWASSLPNAPSQPTTCDEGLQCTVGGVCSDREISAVQFEICNTIPEGKDKSACVSCVAKDGVQTAIGCIPSNPLDFAKTLLAIGTGMAGGFALILMLYGAFMISTSGGNPEQTQKGKEIIGSAITGLVFVAFAIVLLNLVGVEILRIPGF